MTISFKVSKETIDKLNEFYIDLKREKTPPYAVFQADDGASVVTLYESGKIVFQGKDADLASQFWIETEKMNNKKLEVNNSDKKDKKKDEYVDPKKMTDEKILEVVPKIIKKIAYESIILSNKDYNLEQQKGYNMNKIKAILHNKVLGRLKEKYQYDYIVVDQFAEKYVYFSYLKESPNVVKDITFLTKAEGKCPSVACASVISRYIFLKEYSKISKELDMFLPKGAGTKVDEVGIEIVKKYGFDKLKEIAKLNFKNTDKIKGDIK